MATSPVLGPRGTTLDQVLAGWLVVGVRANSEDTLIFDFTILQIITRS